MRTLLVERFTSNWVVCATLSRRIRAVLGKGVLGVLRGGRGAKASGRVCITSGDLWNAPLGTGEQFHGALGGTVWRVRAGLTKSHWVIVHRCLFNGQALWGLMPSVRVRFCWKRAPCECCLQAFAAMREDLPESATVRIDFAKNGHSAV